MFNCVLILFSILEEIHDHSVLGGFLGFLFAHDIERSIKRNYGQALLFFKDDLALVGLVGGVNQQLQEVVGNFEFEICFF